MVAKKMSEKYRLTQEQREGIARRFDEVIAEHSYKTLNEFAKEYEISRSTIQHWFKEGKINIEFMRIFCEKFNVDVRWLLFGPPYEKHQKPRR